MDRQSDWIEKTESKSVPDRDDSPSDADAQLVDSESNADSVHSRAAENDLATSEVIQDISRQSNSPQTNSRQTEIEFISDLRENRKSSVTKEYSIGVSAESNQQKIVPPILNPDHLASQPLRGQQPTAQENHRSESASAIDPIEPVPFANSPNEVRPVETDEVEMISPDDIISEQGVSIEAITGSTISEVSFEEPQVEVDLHDPLESEHQVSGHLERGIVETNEQSPFLPPAEHDSHRFESFGNEQPAHNAQLQQDHFDTSVASQSPAGKPGEIVDATYSDVRSLPFYLFDKFVSAIGWCYGVFSLFLILAVLAGTPILQFLCLGYFLEVSGRIGRTGKFRNGFFGIKKASRVGGVLIGTYLLLIPARYLTYLWYSSQLIDATSTQTNVVRMLQFTITTLLVLHIVAAWFCGGKLRHFFWPLVAPFSLTAWVVRYLASTAVVRKSLNQTVGQIAPRFVQDICRVQPLTDWFMPAILFKHVLKGTLVSDARDRLWDGVTSLNLTYYFSLGVRGFLASMVWLILPTLCLISNSYFLQFIGVMALAVVSIYLPFMQVHFASENRFRAMFEVRKVREVFRRAPIRFWMALLLVLALAIPLYLLKIERIPNELNWLLTIFFVGFMLPAKFVAGWAYARGAHRGETRSSKLLTIPVRLAQIPLIFIFPLFVYLSKFTSWNGAYSFFEQHAFLVPAPFFEFPQFPGF